MSAATLLAELEAAGVHLSLAGDALRVQTRPGVSIAPYRERIATHKPALLLDLLKAAIVAAATAPSDDFDRQHFDRLWAQHEAQEAA